MGHAEQCQGFASVSKPIWPIWEFVIAISLVLRLLNGDWPRYGPITWRCHHLVRSSQQLSLCPACTVNSFCTARRQAAKPPFESKQHLPYEVPSLPLRSTSFSYFSSASPARSKSTHEPPLHALTSTYTVHSQLELETSYPYTPGSRADIE